MMKLFSRWKQRTITDASPHKRQSRSSSRRSAKRSVRRCLRNSHSAQMTLFPEVFSVLNAEMCSLIWGARSDFCRTRSRFGRTLPPRRAHQGVYCFCDRGSARSQCPSFAFTSGILKKLFAIETPEIAHAVVEIKSVAREAGARSKVAVTSHDPKVDPIGSCVGQRESAFLR